MSSANFPAGDTEKALCKAAASPLPLSFPLPEEPRFSGKHAACIP